MWDHELKRVDYTHRIAYRAWCGEITNEIDHLCRNMLCINPAHLQDVVRFTNLARQPKKFRTQCPAGHEFTPANTYMQGGTTRVCRRCHALREQERRATLRAEHSSPRTEKRS